MRPFRLIEVTYDIAREAARIRAILGIRAPDAPIIAIAPGLPMCLLTDLARG